MIAMLNRKQGLLWAIVLFLLRASLPAQSPERLDLEAVGKDPRWKIAGRTVSIVEAKGKRALKMSEGPGAGLAWLDGFEFGNGVIDVDLLGRSQPIQGSFLGVAFRVVDAQTQDVVYFRPFNFRAADPTRRAHAAQYVSHPRWPWERLRSEYPGKYEAAIVPAPDGDKWFHARIVVERPDVRVFVNGAATPCLAVKELSDGTSGSVGVWVGNGSGGYFANLQVTRVR